MWQYNEIASNSSSIRFTIREEDDPISHIRFYTLMKRSPVFRDFYNNILADANFPAYFWENKPVAKHTIHETYECCLVHSVALSRLKPDRRAFNSYYDKNKNIVTFPNLGNDAQLIVPCPKQHETTYSHIGNFVRNCNKQQRDDFWRITATEFYSAIGNEPTWLSTSGMGISWLHARIDTYPKYYQTEDYKNFT